MLSACDDLALCNQPLRQEIGEPIRLFFKLRFILAIRLFLAESFVCGHSHRGRVPFNATTLVLAFEPL